jgi:hypothetical protein
MQEVNMPVLEHAPGHIVARIMHGTIRPVLFALLVVAGPQSVHAQSTTPEARAGTRSPQAAKPRGKTTESAQAGRPTGAKAKPRPRSRPKAAKPPAPAAESESVPDKSPKPAADKSESVPDKSPKPAADKPTQVVDFDNDQVEGQRLEPGFELIQAPPKRARHPSMVPYPPKPEDSVVNKE